MDETILAHTKLLREDDEYPFWNILRNLLTERGIDYSKAYLAFSADEGENSEFGIIVTADRNVFQYYIQLSDDGKDLNEVMEWEDISNHFESTPYVNDIEAAFKIIEST